MPADPRPFLRRVADLPRLGLGVSTEHGGAGAPGHLDLDALIAARPGAAGLLEVGLELVRGIDTPTRRWVEAGRPTTLHFLDVNLDEPEDLGPDWLAGVVEAADHLGAAWLCGDAGLWHFGAREPGQMLLLPPILEPAQLPGLAAGLRGLRAATGREVLPENPPGTFYLGDMGLLDFYGALAEEADTGLLIDVAHLAMYQSLRGLEPTAGLDTFPAERVVELHVAGGAARQTGGFAWIEDTHGVEPLPATWAILEALLPRATNLRAVVVEGERNPLPALLPLLDRLHPLLRAASPWVFPDA